jgi:predicted lipid-binding transport protein (Tim44 family)
LLTALLAGFTVVLAGALGIAGSWAVNVGPARFFDVALLLLAIGCGSWAAIAPPSRRRATLSLGSAALAMIATVALRGPGQPSSLPPWVCTVSHLGVDLAPLAFVLWRMRVAAPSVWRALAGGLAAGVPGAALGELACGQGARHVALFHLPAWLLVVALSWAASRKLRPTLFAP